MREAATQYIGRNVRCNAADEAVMELVSKVRKAHKLARASRTSDEVRNDAVTAAHVLTLRAMAITGISQIGARGKVELLILHHQRSDDPQHPKMELAPLREILELLPVAA